MSKNKHTCRFWPLISLLPIVVCSPIGGLLYFRDPLSQVGPGVLAAGTALTYLLLGLAKEVCPEDQRASALLTAVIKALAIFGGLAVLLCTQSNTLRSWAKDLSSQIRKTAESLDSKMNAGFDQESTKLEIRPRAITLSDGNNFLNEYAGADLGVVFHMYIDGKPSKWTFEPGLQHIDPMETCHAYEFTGIHFGIAELPTSFDRVQVGCELTMARARVGATDYAEGRVHEIALFDAQSCPKPSLAGPFVGTREDVLAAASRDSHQRLLKEGCEVAWKIDGIRTVLITFDVYARSP